MSVDDGLMKAILVRVGEVPIVTSYSSFEDACYDVGIKKNSTIETMLLNDGVEPYQNIGIISLDQDNAGKRRKHLLGLKGNFVVIGMKRLDPDTPENPHMFTGLTEDQIRVVMKGLARAALLGG